MIITLTLNPAVDQTLWVKDMTMGQVNRFSASQLDPAGKGVNVSRMADRLGWPTIAFGLLAGEIGLMVQQALDREHVHYHFEHVPGQTRLDFTIVDESTGRSTSFYGPGPSVPPDALTSLDELLEFWLRTGRVFVLAGSLPPGVPESTYRRYIELAKERGVLTILDAEDDALRLGVEAGPHLVKPNVREAEGLLGHALPDLEAVVKGGRELLERGIGAAVISMGAQGAVCVRKDGAWRALPPEVQLRSTVGSGDSMVAGLAVALARGDDLLEGLRLGTAAGAATAACPGTSLGDADAVRRLLPQVKIERLA